MGDAIASRHGGGQCSIEGTCRGRCCCCCTTYRSGGCGQQCQSCIGLTARWNPGGSGGGGRRSCSGGWSTFAWSCLSRCSFRTFPCYPGQTCGCFRCRCRWSRRSPQTTIKWQQTQGQISGG